MSRMFKANIDFNIGTRFLNIYVWSIVQYGCES